VKYELGFYILEDDIRHSHRRVNLKSYIALTGISTEPPRALKNILKMGLSLIYILAYFILIMKYNFIFLNWAGGGGQVLVLLPLAAPPSQDERSRVLYSALFWRQEYNGCIHNECLGERVMLAET
jgi:hypothetical protein